MFIRARSRLARRRAVLRALNDLRDPRSATDANTSPPYDASFIECGGKPWLIGPGTFLIAAYLRRLNEKP
jgi:hypothetical protein